jgi:hypothetical protein
VIVEFEVSKPLQKRPGRYRSSVQRRWWWLYFAVAVTKGDSVTRRRYSWEDR